MSPIGVARRPSGLAARVGLALLVLLASLGGLRSGDAPPLVRTVVLRQLPTALVVSPRMERAFISTAASGDRSHLAIFDTRTGVLLRTVAVSHTPLALAVDARTEQLLVANADTSVSVLDARSAATP